jgi:hypothetical protein
MKISKTVLTLIALSFVFICAGLSIGQTPKRIEFAKGKSSTVVKGSTGSSGVSYVVRARSGQKLVLDLSPVSNIGIKVETTGADGDMVLLREEKGGVYEIGLEASGDYTIFIGSIDHRPVSFSLGIKITKLADI